VTPHSSS